MTTDDLLSEAFAQLRQRHAAVRDDWGRPWSGVRRRHRRALQVSAPSLGISQRVADTGPLPSTGGTRKNAVVAFSIPGLLQFELLSASTSGANRVAQSQAKVNRTRVLVGLNVVLVEIIIQAFSKAECVNGQPVKSGSTEAQP